MRMILLVVILYLYLKGHTNTLKIFIENKPSKRLEETKKKYFILHMYYIELAASNALPKDDCSVIKMNTKVRDKFLSF